MNYGQVKNQVLKLLNQYTIAGSKVADTYNNQQDYLNRIPSLVNDAVMEIATTTRKINAVLSLEDLPSEDMGEQMRYELPTNFYQWISGSVAKTADGHIIHTNVYTTQGRKFVIVPKGEDGKYELAYYRYPMLLAENPKDTDELDNAPETHRAVAYYVAGMMAMHDDPYIGATLLNKYDDLMRNMGGGVYAEVHHVDDVFGFYGTLEGV